MVSDPKCLVADAYDEIAGKYLARFGASTVRDHWLSELLVRLPAQGGTRVLDLGCGAGIPVARALALPDWSGEWLGTQMFFSHYDSETNLKLLRDADFEIERAQVMDQDHDNARFLWVVARTPASDAT
jgi:hypothetical protein